MQMARITSVHRGGLIAILTGLMLVVPVAAEEPAKPPDTPRLADAARQGWLRVRILSGHITFYGTRLGSISNAGKSDGREERLSIRLAGQELTVVYEMSSAEEDFLLEITGGNQLHVRRTPKGESSLVPVDFRQPADEPLRLTVGPKEQERVYQGATLWHLFVTEPEACRQHLVPLLAVFDEQWDLSRTAEDVEAALLRAAADGDLPDPRRWAALVEQLGDERFARREAADRELRALGRVVFTYLEKLDPSQLDVEQRYRVRRIVLSLSASMENDTPPEIASWMAGDPAVWLAMLSRDDESTRRQAAGRLEALLGEPIPFDPAADAATRAGQIEQVRPRVLHRR